MNRIRRFFLIGLLAASAFPVSADCESCGTVCGSLEASGCIYVDGALVHCEWSNGTQWTLTSSGYKVVIKKC